MEIASIYATDEIISYSFHLSTCYAGSAHPLSGYYCYNYNRITQTEIAFNDFFKIKSSDDSSFFIQEIRSAIKSEGTDFHEIKSMDFNFRGDSISFNFDDYEIASYAYGVIEAPISKKQLNPVIREKYR